MKTLTKDAQNKSIAKTLEFILECVRTGKDMNGKTLSAEELARCLRTLADVVEGKTE